MWQGVIHGEIDVWDWDSKNHLKAKAHSNGLPWVVLQRHRDGTISIAEQSKDYVSH